MSEFSPVIKGVGITESGEQGVGHFKGKQEGRNEIRGEDTGHSPCVHILKPEREGPITPINRG